MAHYKVTASIRGVVVVEADSDGAAGSIARDYLAGLLDAGRAACSGPPEVRDARLDAFVQAVAVDDSQAE